MDLAESDNDSEKGDEPVLKKRAIKKSTQLFIPNDNIRRGR